MSENLIKAKQILKKKIKNNEFLIENFLPSGVTILAGAPKVGKTFFLLQLASAISSKNSKFLDNKCNYAKVLYFSNETNIIEIKRRLRLINNVDNLYFSFRTDLTIRDIELEIYNMKKSKNEKMLIIIDTLQHVTYSKDFDNNNYNDSYKLINLYMQLAEKHNCSFILTHHLNKSTNSNIFNSINGSVAFTGACENILILNRDNDDYKVYIKSRYMPNNSFNLTKDRDGFFKLKNTETLITSTDSDINVLINYVALQENKCVEDTANQICAKAKLKNTTANILYKKLETNKELLEQCNIKFEKYRTAEKRIIKIQLFEEATNTTEEEESENF